MTAVSPTIDDLRTTLGALLSGGLARVVRLERSPAPYRSSSAIEDLRVHLDDGEVIEVIFKDCGPESLMPEARGIRPEFLYDPVREIETYLEILEPLGIDAPKCHGAIADQQNNRYWLFLEKVGGAPLNEIGDFEVWREVARALARMHSAASQVAGWSDRAGSLLRYGPELYETWRRRISHRFERPQQALIERSYRHATDRLASESRVFIHGEFYPSNIIVDADHVPPRVRPLDWETAAIGPASMDVAALTTGWDEKSRRLLISTYWEAGNDLPPQIEFENLTDCSALYLAVQWMCWAHDWQPPSEHARDWSQEAVMIAERLNF